MHRLQRFPGIPARPVQEAFRYAVFYYGQTIDLR